MCYNKPVMKRFPKFTAVVAAAVAAVTLAGCAGSCSSCGSKISNSALTNSNWYTQTGYKGIQPYFIEDNENFIGGEVLKYGVTFESANNGFYSVEYKDGEYSTEFYAFDYDWNTQALENYRVEKTETLYCYKTTFKISVKFSKGSEETEWFEDSVETVSYFRSAYYNLQPVYSSQTLSTTSPAMHNPASLAAAYKHYDLSFVNYYNSACTEVTSYKTENEETTSKTYTRLNKTSNTLFDNSSLYIAVRSMKLSDSLSQSIDLFNAQSGGISTINLKGGATAIEKEELKTISEALAEKNLYTPDEDEEGNEVEDKGVPSVAVSIAYNGGEMSGTTQTVWYAALTDNDANTARCTMLKLAMPLPFGLGTLNFSLKEVSSTIWNN
ncbi:MAG: hypothetical protein K2H30_00395 [Clostridia bacterium]|nr:hypothetical protein [Clostridia bacterium]